MTTPLTSAELEALALCETIIGVESLLDFVPMWTPNFQRPEHLRSLAELIVRARREQVMACVSAPPRHGKTNLLQNGCCWFLKFCPELTIGYAGHTARMAQSKSREIREIARRCGIRLKSDTNSVAEWRTLAGGGLIAGGIDHPWTGMGVNLLIIDDPCKSREEAESPVKRARLQEWFEGTSSTRTEPDASIIVTHTRWHQDDLIGWLLRPENEVKWECINLPAINDSGEALWPGRWPLHKLDIKRRNAGPYEWASQYQGSPRPKGSQRFLEPVRYEKAEVFGSTILIACDPAATAKTSADQSAIVVGAMTRDDDGLPHMDVLDVRTMRVEIPTLVRELIGMQRYWDAPIAVEAVAGFKAVPQMLRNVNRALRVYEISPASDKFVRAQSVQAAWNDGRVRVPVNAPWLSAFLSEVTRFTGVGDAHDDQVDALAHCFDTLDQMTRRRRVSDDVLARLAPMG